jgi:predicted dehydrogenase
VDSKNPANSAVVRIAIVGCGAIVEKIHAPALDYLVRHDPVRVVAAVDPEASRREIVCARFPGCVGVGDLADLQREVDLALVASPVKLHAPQCIELLGRGIHVLCEKPMALDSDECAAMIAAARAAGRLLAVGQVRRFYAVSRQLRSLVQTRALGGVVSFRMFEGSRYEWQAVSDAYFRKQGGGGALRDVGVHLLDLVLWWFGEPSGIEYQDDAMGGVEANARILLSYADGAKGEILLSRDWNLRERIFIRFERGWVASRPNDPGRIEIGLSSDYALSATVHHSTDAVGEARLGTAGPTFQQAFILQLQNVTRAVAGTEPLLVPAEEGARSIGLIESCYRSRQLMPMPWMSEKEQATARVLG